MTSSRMPWPSLDWDLAPWANRFVGGLVQLLGFAMGMFLAAGCMVSLEGFHKSLAPLGLVVSGFVILASVAVHEAGHYLMARRAGMIVTIVQVGPVMAACDRSRWRWRKAERVRSLGGFVVAYPGPDSSVRRQRLMMTSGGPLANLVAAVVLGGLGYLLLAPELGASLVSALDTVFSATVPENPWKAGSGALLLVTATFNLAMGLINLIPKRGVLPSDGLQILRWLRPVDDNLPQLAFQRLIGMSLAGVPSDRVPADVIEALAGQPAPMPLYHFWMVLVVKLQRDEWEAATTGLDGFLGLVDSMSPEMRKALAVPIGAMRCEIDFARAMAGERLCHPVDRALTKDVDWYSPSVRPRLQALQAALDGDAAMMESRLADYAAWARRSIDRSLESDVARLEAAIRSRLAVAADGRAATIG